MIYNRHKNSSIMTKFNYKKIFIRASVLALTLSAFIGILVFLIGKNGELERQFLLTSMAVSVFSVIGLCCSTIFHSEKLKGFSVAGMIVTILAFFSSILIIWQIIIVDNSWKIMGILVLLAVAMGQMSLLLLYKSKLKAIGYLTWVTLVLVIAVTAMLVYSIINDFTESGFYYRLLGILSTLMVLGMIATPLLDILTQKQRKKNKISEL